MAKVVFKYTPRNIYEAEFETKMRGYDKDQVDEMLDGIITDYEAYQSELLRLQEENEFLKNRVAELEKGGAPTDLSSTQNYQTRNLSNGMGVPQQQPQQPQQIKEPSNFDLIKRINRLERAVFGTGSDDRNGSFKPAGS